jgi:hypothetical protein
MWRVRIRLCSTGCWRCDSQEQILMQRDRILVSLGSVAVEILELLAGQALIGSLTGQTGRYSG